MCFRPQSQRLASTGLSVMPYSLSSLFQRANVRDAIENAHKSLGVVTRFG